jgi:hypothetical protein
MAVASGLTLAPVSDFVQTRGLSNYMHQSDCPYSHRYAFEKLQIS